jgi:hypothetical protein
VYCYVAKTVWNVLYNPENMLQQGAQVPWMDTVIYDIVNEIYTSGDYHNVLNGNLERLSVEIIKQCRLKHDSNLSNIAKANEIYTSGNSYHKFLSGNLDGLSAKRIEQCWLRHETIWPRMNYQIFDCDFKILIIVLPRYLTWKSVTNLPKISIHMIIAPHPH